MRETFLSHEIYSLVEYFGTEIEINDTSSYITDDLFINWDLVESVFCDISDNCIIHEQCEEWFNDKKSFIHSIINEARYKLSTAKQENISQLWERCCWTNRAKDIVTCYEYLLENDDCSLLEALLVLTSIIERSIGDLYHIHNNNVPFLLRDLLETEYLYSLLGKGPIRLMQMLFGTPRFLNIRNLAWHGFLSSNELKRNHISILFIIIASISDLLTQKLISLDTIPRRAEVQHFNAKIDKINARNVFINILTYKEHFKDSLQNSEFIGPSHLSFWNKILQYAVENHCSKCLVLFLPQFEHLLRRIFCKINDCIDRTMTAVEKEKYTTLDDIFAPFINKSSEKMIFAPSKEKPNKMYEFLGVSAIELYEDLFSHLAGPRIRDKISHGEKYLENLPFNLINILFNLTFYVINKVNYLQEPTTISINNSMMNELNITFVNYKSTFHPNSILKHKLEDTYKEILNLSDVPKPKDETESIISANSFTQTGNWLKNCDFCTFLKEMNTPTLLRPNEEQKLVKKLSQIVAVISEICLQIIKDANARFEALINKTLGSRQRNRYPEILRSILIVQDAMKGICNIVLYLMHTQFYLNNEKLLDDAKIFKFLITTNSYLDKVLRFSDVKYNKWEEVRNLTDVYNEKTLIFYETLSRNCTVILNK